MSGIKKLAGQTLWYGVPTIASRFLSYVLSIALFHLYKPFDTASITQLYAVIPFLNIVYTYGLETSYFRFVQSHPKEHVYNTLMSSILISTFLLTALISWQAPLLAEWVALPTEFVVWAAAILFFDTLSALPFAKLRQENRPRRYAFIKVMNIVSTIIITMYYLGVCPALYEKNPSSLWLIAYDPSIGIGYYVIANVAGSVITLVLLYRELFSYKIQFNLTLWKKVMEYAYPLVIVGFGGMINEMLSRLVYIRVAPVSPAQAQHELGVFGANYKIAVLITIFIQVFKMAAEPFFFNTSKEKDAPRTYARVMKFFVIAMCIMWLGVVLNLPIIQYLAYGGNASDYAEGLHIIPILAMGSVFLGIYYNLSIWYKLTNKTLTGAWITLAGAAITILLNIWWIPLFGYTGSAWATFACYFFMMVVSYVMGQKHYRIPYAWKKLTAYIVISAIIYGIYLLTSQLYQAIWFNTILGMLLLGAFLLLIIKVERKELMHLPLFRRIYS